MLNTVGMTEAEIILAEQELEKELANFQTVAIIIIIILVLILIAASILKIYIKAHRIKRELKQIKEEKAAHKVAKQKSKYG